MISWCTSAWHHSKKFNHVNAFCGQEGLGHSAALKLKSFLDIHIIYSDSNHFLCTEAWASYWRVVGCWFLIWKWNAVSDVSINYLQRTCSAPVLRFGLDCDQWGKLIFLFACNWVICHEKDNWSLIRYCTRSWSFITAALLLAMIIVSYCFKKLQCKVYLVFCAWDVCF